MPTYEIRFLKPDDSYTKTIKAEIENDEAAPYWLRAAYPRRPVEAWRDGERVARSVSPRHNARLRGWYPRSCRYAPLSAGSDPEAPIAVVSEFADFERLGQLSEEVFALFANDFGQHDVWVRAAAHPLAHPTFPRVCSMHFQPQVKRGGLFVGWTVLGVNSRAVDGETILADLVEQAFELGLQAHQNLGFICEDQPREWDVAINVAGMLNRNAFVRWELPTA